MSIRAPIVLTSPRSFFLEPKHPKQRQYEALRAFYVEGRPSREVARSFGYSAGAFRVLCHAFVREPHPAYFATSRTGPRTQPKKDAARSMVVALRKKNHSVYEIRKTPRSKSSRAVRPQFARFSRPRALPHCHDDWMRNALSNPAPRSRRWRMCAPSRWRRGSFSPAAAACSYFYPSWSISIPSNWPSAPPCLVLR